MAPRAGGAGWQAPLVLARIRHLTFDCQDPHLLARFWSDVLGFAEDPDDPDAPDEPEVLIVDPRGLHPGLLFIRVPEEKSVKNRLHVDLQPVDGRDVTVDRVVELGGSVVADHREADGAGWVVVADPEGNECCIERSAAERGTPAPMDTRRRRTPPGHHTSDERTMLTQMLDWYRDGVIAKVAGVAPHHARAQPLRSATSIAGIVKHLAMVEDSWFVADFAGEPLPARWQGVDWEADPDWEFRTALDGDLDEIVGMYREAIERSRAITAAHHLDDIGSDSSRAEFSLRYVLVHLIEETARHLGHLDVLRELLDGTTGE